MNTLMSYLSRNLLRGAVISTIAVSLTGCMMGSFPDTPISTVESGPSVSPPLQGSVYGGHAPLVGAKVYVLTPNTSTLYGQSASLMDGDTQNSGITPTGTGNGLVSSVGGTNGYRYVTTDSTGAYNLTGDYKCTVDQAVYLVAVGGSPSFPGNPNNVFSISNVTVTNSGSVSTVTFTTTAIENAYIGEQAQFSGFPTPYTALNSATVTIVATNLTTTTFAYQTTGVTTANTNYSAPYPTATLIPTNNPSAVNMTALGLCPSTGSFAGSISYIYTNEVSTAAMAVATAAFGTGPFNVGVVTGGTVDAAKPNYVLNGVKQALNNAGLLYDITGSSITTSYAGEGHIARTVTPAGNGIVPQALMDTWGNILAACVDSNNTATSGASASAQCTTLFATATNTGIPCTIGSANALTCPSGTTAPTEIATAAYNIAHFPAGTATTVGTNPAFVNTLYSLPTANVPFTPHLTVQPNDFSVAIVFTAPSALNSTTNYINAPQVISINGGNYVGNESTYVNETTTPQESVWIGSFGTGSGNGSPTVKLFANGGAPDYTTNTAINNTATTGNSRSVVVDGANNVWMTSEFNENAKEFSNTGTVLQTYTIPTALNEYEMLDAAIDGIGTSYNLYVAGYVLNNVLKAAVVNGTTPSVTNLQTNNAAGNAAFSHYTAVTGSGTAACDQYSTTLAFTPGGTLFLNEDSNIYSYGTNNSSVCTIDTTTGALGVSAGTGSGFFYQNDTSTGAGEGPATVAIDSSGNAWVGGGQTTAAAAVGINKITGSTKTTYTGGGVNDPCGVAIDGANSIWVGNAGTYGVSHFSNAGVALSPVANTATYTNAVGGLNPQINNTYNAPGTTTSVFAPTLGSNCGSPAIDRAGDIWMAYQGSATPVPGVVFEILGIAAPVVSPRAYATFGNGTTGFLGVRP